MARKEARGLFMLLADTSGPPVIDGVFPSAQKGVPYDHSLTILNGKQPFHLDLVSGSLPEGLALEIVSTRLIRLHGTPVVDAIVITGVLPTAYIGTPYSHRLKVQFAVGAVDLDIFSGAMPEWMTKTWHADTGEIEFHGTPTA